MWAAIKSNQVFFFSLIPSFYVRVAMLRLPLEGLTFPSYFETCLGAFVISRESITINVVSSHHRSTAVGVGAS